MHVRLEKLQKAEAPLIKTNQKIIHNPITVAKFLVVLTTEWRNELIKWKYPPTGYNWGSPNALITMVRQEAEKMNPENKKRCQSTLVKQKDQLMLSQRTSKGWGSPLKVLTKLTNHIGSSFDMCDSPTANQKRSAQWMSTTLSLQKFQNEGACLV